MGSSTKETEIKLRAGSAEELRDKIVSLGAEIEQPRHFEDNRVYDRGELELKSSGRLLRLRLVDGKATVTFKADPGIAGPYKVREEHETTVTDGEQFDRIVRGLGYRPVFRYQKYRTVYRHRDVELCLDETPIGVFLEIEGPPSTIDATARRLGFTGDDYVVSTYRELHEQAAGERGAAAGDMVFGD